MSSRSLASGLTFLQQAMAAAVIVVFATSSLLITRQTLKREEAGLLQATARTLAANIDREYQEEGDLARAVAAALEEEASSGVRIDVTDTAGRTLALSGRPVADPRTPPPSTEGMQRASASSACGATVTVSVSNRLRRASVAALGRALLLVAVPLLFVTLFLSRRLIAKAMRPLESMGRRAREASVDVGVRTLGGPVGVVEIDSLGSSFDRLLVRLDEVLQAERRFTADASHELRTPLTVLSGEIEIARAADNLPEGARVSLDRALGQARAMRELVEALLLLRRAGQALVGEQAGFEPVNVADTVREVVREVGERRPERRPDIEISAPDEALVSGIPILLNSGLRNLVDNAIKFTRQGEKIRVAVEEGGISGPDRESVVVTVDDAGRGIAPEERERVFDPFYRGGDARAEATGFGLGLPILRQVARAHGGDVRVEASPLGGAGFVLRLPAWGRRAETPNR